MRAAFRGDARLSHLRGEVAQSALPMKTTGQRDIAVDELLLVAAVTND